MKLMKKAVPHTSTGIRNALVTICLIQCLPAKYITLWTTTYDFVQLVNFYELTKCSSVCSNHQHNFATMLPIHKAENFARDEETWRNIHQKLLTKFLHVFNGIYLWACGLGTQHLPRRHPWLTDLTKNISCTELKVKYSTYHPYDCTGCLQSSRW